MHDLLLFLHVSAAMGIFAALGLEGAMLLQLGQAESSRDLRTAFSPQRTVQRVGAASAATALVTGIALASLYWRWQGAWMGFGFLSLVAIAVVGATMSGRAIAAAFRSPPDAAALQRLRRRLAMSFSIRLALLAGVIVLMTVKPSATLTALAIVVVAAVLGVAIGTRRGRSQSTPDEREVVNA